jgi:hypothetical protein
MELIMFNEINETQTNTTYFLSWWRMREKSQNLDFFFKDIKVKRRLFWKGSDQKGDRRGQEKVLKVNIIKVHHIHV